MAEDKFNQANDKPYLGWIREQLKITNTRVRKWVEWDEKSDIYEAFFETRSVVIPIPVCKWSFLVALHEIGHISTGDRIYSYVREYNAEQWAIKRALTYGVVCDDYIIDAKSYVRDHLLQDIVYTELNPNKVSKHIMDWVGEDVGSLVMLKEKYKKTAYDDNFMGIERSSTRSLLTNASLG